MDELPNASGDGPGAEAAPLTQEAPPAALPVLVVAGVPTCPRCNAELGEGGSVRIPMMRYVDLRRLHGGLEIVYGDTEDGVDGKPQCAACHGELDQTGWSW